MTKGKLFVSGHDRSAAAMLIRLLHGSVAGFVADSGYGPGGRNLRADFERWEAQRKALHGWERLQALHALERLETRRKALEAELVSEGLLAREGSEKNG